VTALKLDGVLAIRQSWCLPDEDVLLCAPSGSIGFDVAGLDWRGRRASGPAPTSPQVVVFGPDADAEAPTACADLGGPTPVWCVLTPLRLAWVRAVGDRSGSDGSVRRLAKGIRESLAGKGTYPAHRPVETVGMWSVAEVPSALITSVTTAERTLPRDCVPRDVHVLRVALADGSGVDVVAGRRVEQARRLLDLATGRS
jgi:hypothetical protein